MCPSALELMFEKNTSLYEPDLSGSLKKYDGVRTEGLGVVICMGVITIEYVDILRNGIDVNIATSPICT